MAIRAPDGANNDDDCHYMIYINIPILFQIFQSLVVYATNCNISYRSK